MEELGINFAIDNIQANRPSGWAAGTGEDTLPHTQREAFRSGVRLVEELDARQRHAIRHLASGGSNYTELRRLPASVMAELRRRLPDLDNALSLIESGKATWYLPPYGE